MVTTVSEKVNKNGYYLSEERITLVMTPFTAYYLVQSQPKSNHELSIKFTNLSKRSWSLGCYAYHEIIIFTLLQIFI